MNEDSHSIFRPESIQRYTDQQQEGVLPRFISPPTLRLFKGLIVALLLLLGVMLYQPIPQYAQGVAIQQGDAGTDMGWLVQLPTADEAARLRVGQQLRLASPSGEERSVVIEKVQPAPSTSAMVDSDASRLVRTSPTYDGDSVTSHNRLMARVQVGSQRLISLLVDMR